MRPLPCVGRLSWLAIAILVAFVPSASAQMTVVPSPTPKHLVGICATGDKAEPLVALDEGGKLIVFSDRDQAWHDKATTPRPGTWTSLWASGPDSIYVGGPALFRYDAVANKWSEIKIKDAFASVRVIAGSRAADVVIAALDPEPGPQAVPLLYTRSAGNTWTRFATGGLAPGTEVRSVWVSDGRELFAIIGSPDGTSVVSHYGIDPETRVRQLHPMVLAQGQRRLGNFRCIWGAGNEPLYVVGDAGLILRFDAKRATWFLLESERPLPRLVALAGSSPDDVWAVGEEAAVVHLTNDGKQVHVTPEPQVTFSALAGVVVHPALGVVAVGKEGTILHSVALIQK